MSDIRVKTCVLGAVSTNCYLVYNETSREAVVIDPADNAAYILNKCSELEITPKAVLLTHGHFDHILAVPDICRAFRVDVYAAEAESDMLADTSLNLSGSYGTPQTSFRSDKQLQDGDEFELLGIQWKALKTPGHTSGSMCFYIPDEGAVFAGDTLFYESFGRTDLPTGSSSQIVRSIVETLFGLPDDTMVYPGHGDPTTIGHEKERNPVAMYR